MKTTTKQGTTAARKHSDFARDFSATTRRALAKRGIFVIGIVNVPGRNAAGAVDYTQGSRGYELDDNGTLRIRSFLEVMALGVAVAS